MSRFNVGGDVTFPVGRSVGGVSERGAGRLRIYSSIQARFSLSSSSVRSFSLSYFRSVGYATERGGDTPSLSLTLLRLPQSKGMPAHCPEESWTCGAVNAVIRKGET